MKGKVEEIKKMDRASAVEIVRNLWALSILKEYTEPERTRRQKGEPVGFSKNKLAAALLSVLYPMAYNSKELAKASHTSFGVLRVWRTEEPFQKAIRDAELSVARLFIDTIRHARGTKVSGEPYPFMIGKSPAESVDIAWKFLSSRLEGQEGPDIAIPAVLVQAAAWLSHEAMREVYEALAREAERDKFYLIMCFRLLQTMSLHDKKTIRHFYKENSLLPVLLKMRLGMLADPGMTLQQREAIEKDIMTFFEDLIELL